MDSESDPDQNLIACSLVHFLPLLKIPSKSISHLLAFAAKTQTDKQTNKQTNGSKNITFALCGDKNDNFKRQNRRVGKKGDAGLQRLINCVH